MARVFVVGAGVVGLSCAVRLLREGHHVDVVARDLPLETTSAVAAAIWYPYRAYPYERVTGWSATAYTEFTRLAAAEPDSGVRMLEGTELLRTASADPWWKEAVPSLSRVASPPRPYADGWSFRTPVVEMPVYLRWLHKTVEELGGTLTRMALNMLPDQAEVVVDACGLGARLLASDTTVVPIRGQVVYVEQFGLDRWWLAAGPPSATAPGPPTYVVPRRHDVVVGGTDDEGRWDRSPDPAVAGEILERAAELVPGLRGATVLRHKVGLRPARPSVRLEAVSTSSRAGRSRVVHCYGHGGAGVTLSWGCAEEVAGLVRADA